MAVVSAVAVAATFVVVLLVLAADACTHTPSVTRAANVTFVVSFIISRR
jgi:hypothetical protein